MSLQQSGRCEMDLMDGKLLAFKLTSTRRKNGINIVG
jgi:hypothetical protein